MVEEPVSTLSCRTSTSGFAVNPKASAKPGILAPVTICAWDPAAIQIPAMTPNQRTIFIFILIPSERLWRLADPSTTKAMAYLLPPLYA